MATSTVWKAICWFEIRYHLRQPLFYLVTFFLSVLLFLAGTGHSPGAPVGRLHLNAPAVILQLLVKMIFLVLFLMTAFVASAAVRDFDRRTSELFFSKPISPFDYLTGRFAGTMVVCALAYLVGTGALAVSTFMPWVDPSRLGPFRLAPYAFGLGVLVLPTLLALGAVFYAFASWRRSTLATYLCVVAFFAASALAGMAASRLGSEWMGQLLDPFGVVALGSALKYWTVAELNATTPAIVGPLLWNRILWLGLGFLALGLSVAAYDPSRSRKRPDPKRDAADTAPPVDAIRVRTPAARRVFSRHSVLVQFLRQVRREATTVLWNLPFLGIVALGLFVLIPEASSAGNLNGMPVHPRTYLMLEALRGLYSAILLLVAVLYSGELIWKERALEVDEVVDSMPAPSGVYFGAKLTALLLVIGVFLLVGVLALIGFQLWHGYTNLELGVYAQGIALASVYPVLMMVLACFCHVVARSKLVGYGLVFLFLLSWDLVFEELGFEHRLYRFASLPPAPYSDFTGHGPFLAPFGWYSLYWGFGALVLAGLSILLWKRGTDAAWRVRWAEARARFRGPARGVIAIGALGLVATGSWILYNTNVLNAYVPSAVAADRRASYERLYRRYQGLDLPRIMAVRADVDIFPDRRRVEIRGSYRLRNRSGRPLRDLHVSLPERVRLNRLDLPAHDVVLEDEAQGYRILRLRTPLQPDEAIDLGFDLTVESRGFVNHGADIAVLANGTYFTKRDYFPVIGYDPQRQLADPEERRQRGLEPVRLPGRDDLAARRTTPRSSDADRVDFESTVSTSLDQIAVTSGELQREWVENGRRYFHYRAEIPITHHFAYASARFEVTRSEQNGVAIEVYHHPGHGGNVGRMIDAARKSLAYFTVNFSPYPYRSVRIVEFPRYATDDGTAFPGLIALSERLGFNARLDGEEAIDFPFYITAHEIAHQWWGHQLVGANVQGVGVLHETLASYSALMVLEHEVGREKLRRVLEYELDRYLRGRGKERGVEPPLVLTERQEYAYYRKGALAMYALRDAVGEERLNAALSRLLSSFASGGPPYATTADLLAAISSAVPEESSYLVGDLFENVTTFNNKVATATFTERADGKFLVRVEVELHKHQADSAGVEREIPINDWIDIAVLGEGEDRKSGGPVLVLERRRIHASPARARSIVEIVVDRRPAQVAIDPYYKLIDRDRGDNARAVLPAGAEASR